MAAHNVEYQISLKDLLSGKIREAEGHVNHFEHTLEHTQNITKELMGAAVGFFGLYQGIEFIKGSVDAYNNVEKSLSQLRAGLESTGGAAGVTYEELTEGAEKFAASTIYNKEVLLDMQAQLLSFPEVTKDNFEDAEQAIMDLATRTGHSLHDVSIMVGKALGDPTKGITALRRVGVEFSESQTEVIKKLAETGHVAEAQRLILKELGREYAGSTSAASATAGGQMEILKHRFDEVKESVGKLVMEETVKLAPTIKKLIEDLRHLIEWVDKNKDGIIEVTKVVAEVTIGMWAFGKATAAIEGMIGVWETLKGVVIATKGVMAETTAASAIAGVGGAAVAGEAVAGEAAIAGSLAIPALGEIVVSVLAIAAVAAGAYALYEHFKSKDKEGGKHAESAINDQHGGKPTRKDVDAGHAHYSWDPFDSQPIRWNNENVEMPIPEDFKKKHPKVTDPYELRNLYKQEEQKMKSEMVITMPKPEPLKHKEVKTNTLLNEAQTSVQGQTVKNIYVTINGGLIHDFTVKTTSVKEAVPDIKRVVTQTMADAINDSELNN